MNKKLFEQNLNCGRIGLGAYMFAKDCGHFFFGSTYRTLAVDTYFGRVGCRKLIFDFQGRGNTYSVCNAR